MKDTPGPVVTGIPRTGEQRANLLLLVPVAVLVAAACLLAWVERGSVLAEHWLPYAVAATLVLGVTLLSGSAASPGRLGLGALAGLAALAAWEAASIGWSPLPSLARTEALLVALYAVALAVGLVVVRGDQERRLAEAVVVVGIGAVALGTAVELWLSGDPASLYEDGRLYAPISYWNACAAFFLVAFWPAVALAASRSLPALARAASLGLSAAMLGCWLLTQSKGGGAGLAASAVVFFAVCPCRTRALVPAAVGGVLAAAGAQRLTAPFRADDVDALVDAIRVGGLTVLVITAAGTALGLGYALVDRRVRVGPRTARVAGAVALALVVAGLAGGVAGFFVAVDRPGGYLADRWREFKHLPTRETGSTHLFSLGSNRYDFWRVALDEFRDHPLAGRGAHAFAADYLREGRSVETPERAHSVVMDQLGETGIVGFALLVGSLGLALAAAVRRSTRSLTAAAALGAAVYFLAHSTVDWIWTFPAVGVPAFLLLGLAGGGEGALIASRVAVPAGVAAIALGLLAFAPPWLSARLIDQAYSDRADAAAELRWARRLDPLSTEPLVAEADLARSPADIPPLERAVAKEPERADLRYRLGVAYLEAGRRQDARRELAAARRLYPADELIAGALRRAQNE